MNRVNTYTRGAFTGEMKMEKAVSKDDPDWLMHQWMMTV
jgi:hypothetical protein